MWPGFCNFQKTGHPTGENSPKLFRPDIGGLKKCDRKYGPNHFLSFAVNK
jgi:hypothetical protein